MTATQPQSSTSVRRVLLLTQDLEVWGAQRQLVELAKGLWQKGYDVRVGTLETGGPLTSELNEFGISVEDFSRRWRWDASPISRLATYLRSNAIDIVHSFMFLPNFYTRFAGRLAGTPAVVSSLRSTGIEGWPRYALDVGTCFMCDVLIANSAAGRDHYVSRGGLRNRIVVVRNGLAESSARSAAQALDARATLGCGSFGILIGMVAAMEFRKDQALLVRAMQSVVRDKPQAGLVLAGDGSTRCKVEQLVRTLGLESHVTFLGTVRQAQLLYPLLDVYVQASFGEEGTSNSILEAMAHGLPVIATDVGGNREVVVDGRTGILVRKGDVQGLSQAILDLLDHPERRVAMGRAGQERFRTEFSLDVMVSATERVYDRVLEAKAAGKRAQAKPSSHPSPDLSHKGERNP